MTYLFYIGFGITLLLFMQISISAGLNVGIKRQKKGESSDQSGTMVISGAIIGTLVGGSSTIGTAQLAYAHGMSAWWFTLGSGIACFILALGFVVPLRKRCKNTLTGMISEQYGTKIGLAATLLSTVGMYINIIAQLISAASIVMMILPHISLFLSILISAVLMVIYAVSGGVNGIGKIGIFKTILLYFTMIGGGCMVLRLFGGMENLLTNPILMEGRYFGLFNRGIEKDLGNGISVILGVLSTQTYIQAILAGKTDRCAKKGALLSAVMIPPIGIGGILIGMYMRVYGTGLSESKFALPQFVLNHMPQPLAGIIFATLLITILGTGAGLALGIGTTLRKDLLDVKAIKSESQKLRFFTERKLVAITLFSATILASSGLGTFILDFSFMSMALRATVVFVPMLCILFVPEKIDSDCVFLSVVIGPLVVLAGNLFSLPFDSLFLGLAVNTVILWIGYLVARKDTTVKIQ